MSFLIKFVFLLFCQLPCIHLFNLDTEYPIYKFGSPNSWFGFSVAAHFTSDGPSILVGAPKWTSGQPGTLKSGAVYACKPDSSNGNQCQLLSIEYPNLQEAKKPPNLLHGKHLHPEGKNGQLLGFSVYSSGMREEESSKALVCAPLLRWGQNAYTDGVCYLLGADLNHKGIINTCGPLPKKDRHNDYGSCEQGFSAFIDSNVTLTGIPGARKWTGGVFAKYDFVGSGGFVDSVDRRTMELDKNQGGVLALLASHDYLGYSVHYGRFGFSHEDEKNFTVVSGATRFNQTGAVIFLPFRRNFHAEEGPNLGLLDDHFILSGRQLGSGFGSSLAVLDLNNDGFDDLLVGAPFEYFYDEEENEKGGAVYIYFSKGIKLDKGQSSSNNLIFYSPIIIRGTTRHSHFGASLASIGNLNNDKNGFKGKIFFTTDFVVGAPYHSSGSGAVFVFHGNERAHFSTEPAQQIFANNLPNKPNFLKSFGFSLAKGVDLDGDGYAELIVGAPESNVVTIFRSKPVLEVKLNHQFEQKHVKISTSRSDWGDCALGPSCFSLSTSIFLFDRNLTALKQLNKLFGFGQSPFLCKLEVLPFARGVLPRALFTSNGETKISWPCGSNAVTREEISHQKLYIPVNWTNPLRFNFSISLRKPQLTTINNNNVLLPAISPDQTFHIFGIAFDKLCGDDNECHTNLVLSGALLDLSKRSDGLYQAKVTEKDVLILRLLVENRAERAYLAKLYLEYDETELDEPSVVKRGEFNLNEHKVDIEKRELGKALGFDLLFKLVRSSSERVSASLQFKVFVNSSSVEDFPKDNFWKSEVLLIKEADLQLDGGSRPPIVHFSRGNYAPKDEFDIGPQLIHAYTLTNKGPFYARNVTLKIDWPLRLDTSSPNSDWLLYILEEPLIRHNGQFRRCPIINTNLPSSKLINSLNIYNDATLKLDYYLSKSPYRQRKPRNLILINSTKEEEENLKLIRHGSILQLNSPLWPKWINEESGERVKVVDINCKDNSAHCVQLTCHFDYIGSNDSALIEIRARNNFARITTRAYPDRPQQEDHINLKRPQLELHQAHYAREREEMEESFGMGL
uniref:Integrin alpha-2 domain-containing protein n=1 Tax=Meloidogyne floridensis TaxID=298350 RepID=A0A915NNY2_9BILA